MEYAETICETNKRKTCSKKNKNSAGLSNMKLCRYDRKNKVCQENKILSKYKLVYVETPPELLLSGIELNSIENIYRFIYQPMPNAK